MKKIKITLVKSMIKHNQRQRRTVEALGLSKLHKSIEKEATPQVEGMIHAVQHLLKIEKI